MKRQVTRRGNCYVASEALYHILGGKRSGWKIYRMPWLGDTHWFLARQVPVENIPLCDWYSLLVLDPSRKQFKKANRPDQVDYNSATCTGFLTKYPSKRARKLMKEMTWQTL